MILVTICSVYSLYLTCFLFTVFWVESVSWAEPS